MHIALRKSKEYRSGSIGEMAKTRSYRPAEIVGRLTWWKLSLGMEVSPILCVRGRSVPDTQNGWDLYSYDAMALGYEVGWRRPHIRFDMLDCFVCVRC